MNTPRSPRETLLARHSAARPLLDAQHAALLARFAATPSDSTSPRLAVAAFSPLATLRDLLITLNRELVAPYRLAWASLACVWLAILGFQALDRISPSSSAATTPFAASGASPTSDAPLLALWLEQRRQLAALTADTGVRPVPAPARENLSPPPAARPLGLLAPAPACLAFV